MLTSYFKGFPVPLSYCLGKFPGSSKPLCKCRPVLGNQAIFGMLLLRHGTCPDMIVASCSRNISAPKAEELGYRYLRCVLPFSLFMLPVSCDSLVGSNLFLQRG